VRDVSSKHSEGMEKFRRQSMVEMNNWKSEVQSVVAVPAVVVVLHD
jgi:hypothetical protein